ncbi:faciogenital dysplasia protein [Anaeramoeba flamelloides]|uniref:Faciogenital dysplasia protein n=1 Tax=Anaeramoeba flamelloides TaxID=1746091 RepID=A0AAV7YJB3_9EUKA|nr:faciogenital dysplasia protein [Anaeramoeba flamelloides]
MNWVLVLDQLDQLRSPLKYERTNQNQQFENQNKQRSFVNNFRQSTLLIENVFRGYQARKKMKKSKLLINFQTKKKVITEIIETETEYLKNLKYIRKNILQHIVESQLIADRTLEEVVSQLKCIYQLNKKEFFDILIKKRNNSIDLNYSAIFLNFASKLKFYSPYVNSYDMVYSVLMDNCKNNRKLKKWANHQNKNIFNIKASLSNCLIMPIQRTPKYILFLKRLIKYTNQEASEHKKLNESLGFLQDIVHSLNSKREQLLSIRRLKEISFQIKHLQFELIQPSRYFVCDSQIDCFLVENLTKTEMRNQNNLKNIISKQTKKKKKKTQIFLFNDCIIITLKSNHKTFLYQDVIWLKGKKIQLSEQIKFNSFRISIINTKKTYLFFDAEHQNLINYFYSQLKTVIKNLIEKERSFLDLVSFLKIKLKQKNPNYKNLILKNSSGVMYKSYLYLFGGEYQKKQLIFFQNDLHCYDLATKKWKKPTSIKGRFPKARSFHTATRVNSKIYIFGGRGSNNEFLNDIHYFDARTFSWYFIDTNPLPGARAWHSCNLVNDRLIVIGGTSLIRNNSVWVYHIKNKKWESLSIKGHEHLGKAYGHSSVFWKNKMYIIAGERINYSQNPITVINFETNTCKQVNLQNYPDPLNRTLIFPLSETNQEKNIILVDISSSEMNKNLYNLKIIHRKWNNRSSLKNNHNRIQPLQNILIHEKKKKKKNHFSEIHSNKNKFENKKYISNQIKHQMQPQNNKFIEKENVIKDFHLPSQNFPLRKAEIQRMREIKPKINLSAIPKKITNDQSKMKRKANYQTRVKTQVKPNIKPKPKLFLYKIKK